MENHFLIRDGNFSRRLSIGVLILAVILTAGCSSSEKGPLLVQEPLPYAENSLEPYVSAKTMNFHYHKHHAGYIARTNGLLNKNPVPGTTLEEVIRSSYQNKKQAAVFTNAAQAWNHAFFWKCLKPGSRKPPQGNLKKMIDKSFGSCRDLKKMMIQSADAIVGSGWVWIIQDKQTLKVITTANADTPIASGQKPVFTLDVWEHAYYLDYQNKRAEYVAAILDNLVDWEFVASQIH